MLQKERVALVTGAARGLGWGIARAFGIAGARVCVTDINEDELARCARDLAADGTEDLAFHSDVANLAECKNVVKKIVDRWGRLDVVVHNAIYMPLITFEATTPEEWGRQINVGIGGMFNCTHAVWNQMKAQGGGHIIGIASGSSIRGYKEEIAYCTIKHGIEGFVKALSLEAKDYNIALNTIGPGARIKPTRLSWAEYDRAPADLRATWADPVELGKAWVWLATQPPGRFTGCRFDAATLVQTIAREGHDFEFEAEKVTLYPDDFRARQEWYSSQRD
ncbi:MAG: SDR family oxidoreductase [Bacillati bacterium ANGP1]|uniref:SDR family oxidoreductase n=1 Tax=Candidatus Segetimicrobium genomatis TaxID=2569760 RepID=A0A537K861_9BACT|nr:MAG: SDR family oxidoreductase [Terrabacteria group bacterium ANGP1]